MSKITFRFLPRAEWVVGLYLQASRLGQREP